MLNTKLWPTHDQAKTAQTSLVSAANYLLQIIAALILNINKPLNHVCLYLLKQSPTFNMSAGPGFYCRYITIATVGQQSCFTTALTDLLATGNQTLLQQMFAF